MRTQAVLVQEGVVPAFPLAVGIPQVVQLVDVGIHVGVVVAAIDRMEHHAARRKDAQGLAVHRHDHFRWNVLEHAVGEHHVHVSLGQPGTGGIGGRAVVHDAIGGRLQRIAGEQAVAQSTVALPDLVRVRSTGIGDPGEKGFQAVHAARGQVGAQVGVQVAGDDPRGACEVARQREGRVPAGADFEAAQAVEGHAGVTQVAGHDRPVVDLAFQFAPEILQAAELPLQVEVQCLAARQKTQHFLDGSLDSPMHVGSVFVSVQSAGTASGASASRGAVEAERASLSWRCTSRVERMPTKAWLSAKPVARPWRHFSTSRETACGSK